MKDLMLHYRVYMGILFGAVFALAFIFVGIRRMFEAGSGAKKRESIFWGLVGIAIGLGLFWWIYHFVTDPVPP